MPAVSRLGDHCTGHGPWPPRPSTGASPDVFVNGIAVHRKGDSWAVHCSGTIGAGDGIVFLIICKNAFLSNMRNTFHLSAMKDARSAMGSTFGSQIRLLRRQYQREQL